MVNFYELLDVPPSASIDQIEAAYRLRAKEFHPDHNGHDPLASERTRILNEAFETLRDPRQRAAYDKRMRNRFGPRGIWEPVPMERDIRGVMLHVDGAFSLGAQRIEPHMGFRSADFNGMTLSYDQWTRILEIVAEGTTYRLRYQGRRWLRFRPTAETQDEGAARSQESPASPQPPRQSQTPPEPPLPPQARASGRRRALTVLAVVAIVAACLAIGFYRADFFSPGELPKLPLSKAEFDAQQAARLAEQNAQHAEAQRQQQEQQRLATAQALARSELEAANAVARSIHEALATWETEVAAWKSLVENLPTNEDGAWLASKDEYVAAFEQLVAKHPPETNSLAAIRTELGPLLAAIPSALPVEPLALPPGDEVLSRLKARLPEILAATDQVRTSRVTIEQLIATARNTGQPNEGTLAAAIALRRAAIAETKARELAEIAAAADEADRKQAAEVERRRRDTERDEQRMQAETEERRRREKLQHDKDLAEAQTKEVRETLAFFLTAGHLQPTAGGVERRTEKLPMSLSGLESAGALENSPQGLQRLYSIACHVQEKERPRWGIDNNVQFIATAQFERLKRSQDYLRRLGYVLVELNALAP